MDQKLLETLIIIGFCVFMFLLYVVAGLGIARVIIVMIEFYIPDGNGKHRKVRR